MGRGGGEGALAGMRQIADHILDLVRNAVEAGTRELELMVAEDSQADRLEITVRDKGQGMDAQTLARVTDAFFTSRTTRRQGLGLPLFIATCQRCGGDATIESAPGQGTVVRGWMQTSHLDRPPLGDLGGVVQTLALESNLRFWRYEYRVNETSFVLESDGWKRVPGMGPAGPAALVELRASVNRQVGEMGGAR